MSRIIQRIGLMLILITLIGTTSSTQAQRSTEQAQVQQLLAAVGPGVRISYHQATGKVRFIGATLDKPIARPVGVAANATATQAADAFMATYGALFGTTNPAQELQARASRAIDRNRVVVRYQQLYRDVPVLGGELNVQLTRNNQILTVNGELQPNLALSTTPAVSAADARQAALGLVAKHQGYDRATLKASAPELWIYAPALLGGRSAVAYPALVWRTEVTAGPLAPLRELVLVDAQLGNVALNFNQIAAGKERFVCDRNNVVDENDECTPATAVRSEGQAATGIADVDLAYDYAGLTYDFFFTKFGRDSLDGNGLQLRSTVRYCPDEANCPYQNAYWNGVQMVYGDGFASADDVVGHELTHGVTDFTSSLFYYYQSGAINESLSDVFGELIDLTYDTASDNDTAAVRWQLGEDLPEIGAIRDMKDPTSFGDPDKMTSPNYTDDLNELDSGGVHQNSGVNNKTAYLLTDGDTFNGRTVTGLGIDKVARIYYDAETNMLLSASDYADLYDYLQQACVNLTGTAGITAADCQEVKDAVDATEMNIQPPAAPAPEAPMCVTGQSPVDAFFDNLENPSSGNWISSATTGLNHWFYPQTINPYDFDATYATSGVMNFWGDDVGGSSASPTPPSDYNIGMTSSVTLPASAFMHFHHSYGFEDFEEDFYDGGMVEYSTNNGSTWTDAGSLFLENGYNGSISTLDDNPLAGRPAFVAESNGYLSSRLNLSSLAGQNVRFRFRIGTDSTTGDYGWFIDDIRIYTCSSALAANDDSYSVGEGNPLTVAAPGVLANDTNATTSGLSASVVDDVDNGSLTLNANGGFTYTPDANFSGTDTFTYRIVGGSAPSNVATVTITVTPRGEYQVFLPLINNAP